MATVEVVLPESGYGSLRADMFADQVLCFVESLPDALLPDDPEELTLLALELAAGIGEGAELRGVDAELLLAALAEGPACVMCGCTEYAACADDGSGLPCHWVASDPPLCSACGRPEVAA